MQRILTAKNPLSTTARPGEKMTHPVLLDY